MDKNLHPDIARMSIHDLWCLTELFEHLADTALSFTNQPRVQGAAHDFAGDFMEHYCHHYQSLIMDELKARVPSSTEEAERRSQAIVRYWAGSDSYDELLAAVQEGKDAAEWRCRQAAENRRLANGG